MKYEEKIRKRKEAHTAIEKKRREKIAACMNRLRVLVPENREHESLQKLTILQNTVEYVEQLQRLLGIPIQPDSQTIDKSDLLHSSPITNEIFLLNNETTSGVTVYNGEMNEKHAILGRSEQSPSITTVNLLHSSQEQYLNLNTFISASPRQQHSSMRITNLLS
ncbi:hypothetical protein BC833DRAFT_582911 [Globomyces pollinis-pini]|nr:hypothetical protein BC833DRAFT_582911 [Globomyces pollinis-pini]